MNVLVFTPGQREEALSWMKKECEALATFVSSENKILSPLMLTSLEDAVTDAYLKLKAVTFDLKPEEFIIGIEYKDREKVIKGEEAINIRFQNPRRETVPADSLAQQIIIELLERLKT